MNGARRVGIRRKASTYVPLPGASEAQPFFREGGGTDEIKEVARSY